MFRTLLLLMFLLSIFILQTNLKAEELGKQHAFGLGFLLSYEYEEPHFMHLRAGVIADEHEAENIGFLYNYKNSFITNGYLSELEFDSSYQFLTQSYWSNGSGTMKDIDVRIYNLRTLYGIKLSNKLMLKSGLGYRHLYHHWKNRVTTTGGKGYDREQDYTYIPIIAEINTGKGKLKVEFDHVIQGNNTSYISQSDSTSADLDFKNNNGFMFKTSFEIKNNGFSFEPYYEFLGIEESDLNGSSKEPSNTTHEIGFKIIKEFNSNKSKYNNYKKLLNNDEFYFGVQALMSEVESGFYAPTGTAKIEEEGTGFSIVSGMQILDSIKGLPIKLGIEVAFNQFGDSITECSSGDTVTTDGRYAAALYTAGTVLSCTSDNIDIAIESHSTSFGIKPSYKIIDNLIIDANLGIHRWGQSENTYWPDSGNSSTLTNYGGTSTYMGIGLEYGHNNFSAEIGYLEHNMEYDAKSFTTSLKYNF